MTRNELSAEFPLSPLLPDDQPEIGGYWLDAALFRFASGTAYLAHPAPEDPDRDPVVVVQLSEGAAADKAARDRFSGLVNKQHIDTVIARGGYEQDSGRLGRRYHPQEHVDAEASSDSIADPHADRLAPWVALSLADPATPRIAEALLADVTLEDLPPKGRESGPDYRHYWAEQTAPGRNRIWPLPWPGRFDRGGWVTILASWLLMLVLAAIAVLIAILLFHNEPPQSPPPPQQSPSSSSSSSASPSPSDSSASPSPSNATASPSESGKGSPTPDSRL
ncbi:hypothetical protein [Granulicoccus phenolivorans]|uniref:hypothetical protein n=1 Tax=Granulicoccus phenolivorans TaxID=266854 RepID=UPI00047A0473|nr:hypothetical protein [Granulicoccus phenolivorans]